MFISPSPFINLRYTAIVENYNIRRRKKINSNQFENKALVLCPGVVVLRLVLFFVSSKVLSKNVSLSSVFGNALSKTACR